MVSGGSRLGQRRREEKAKAEALQPDGRAARGRAPAFERHRRLTRSRAWRPSTTCWPICPVRYRTWMMTQRRSRLRRGMRRSFRPSFPTSWVRPAHRVPPSTVDSLRHDSLRPRSRPQPAPTVDFKDLTSGLSQLNKYLSRAWYRAGISPQLHDDSTQAVYATLLQQLGRSSFDSLIADVGHSGIKDVFTRETSEGLAFFRAVDMVKKRAQRERVHHSLDSLDVAGPVDSHGTSAARRQALLEAIEHTLKPREAALIRDTLMGKTPAEIADQWGVAPKTVSNEKTRVLQKLRLALADHEMN